MKPDKTRGSIMRQVESVEFHGQWVVKFDDGSTVVVDISGAVHPHEKTKERIKSAAMKYSEAHPEGRLSSVVVDLSGRKIN